MQTKEILFLQDRTVQDGSGKKFAKGEIVTLRADSANHWIGRGVATDDAEQIAAAKAAAKSAGKGGKSDAKKQDAPKPGAAGQSSAGGHAPAGGAVTSYEIADLGGGKFDVIDADGKPQNEAPLSRADAEALLAELGKIKA